MQWLEYEYQKSLFCCLYTNIRYMCIGLILTLPPSALVQTLSPALVLPKLSYVVCCVLHVISRNVNVNPSRTNPKKQFQKTMFGIASLPFFLKCNIFTSIPTTTYTDNEILKIMKKSSKKLLVPPEHPLSHAMHVGIVKSNSFI